MCPRVYLILARDMKRQPSETRDPLTRTSWTTKKVRANKGRHERIKLHESIRDECFHLHSRSHVISGFLGKDVQPALDLSLQVNYLPLRWNKKKLSIF